MRPGAGIGPGHAGKVVVHVRTSVLVTALALCAALGACAACQAAHLTGLYWIEHEVYCLDVTLHNNESGDHAWVLEAQVHPGAFDAQAPPFWIVGWGDWHVAWAAYDGHWLPPGEELSGFTFQTYDMAEEYSYKIRTSEGSVGGYFTPELIPWPPATGPVALAILGLWAAHRIRRR